MIKIITSILLIFVAILLAMFILPLGFIYAIVVMCIRSVGDFKTYRYFYRIAQGIDSVGNATCKYLFNDILIKPNAYPFGDPQETISSVMGKNAQLGKLTWCGKALNWLLCKIEKDHTAISVQKNVSNTEF